MARPQLGAPSGRSASPVSPASPTPWTTDTLLRGALPLRQPARGHRVNLDAVLLAAFAATCRPRPAARCGIPFPRAADLGAGTGAVALLLHRARILERALLVEAEPSLAELARSNAEANGLPDSLDVLCADLRGPPPAGWRACCDLVVANPPYQALGAGKPSPDPLRAAARHEVRGGLREFASAAAALLRPGGTFCVIYPWGRREFALEALAAAGLTVRRERLHRPRDGATPVTVCFEASAGAPAARARREELVLHAPPRRFSPIVERFLDGDYAGAARSSASEIAPRRTTR